MNHLMHQAMRSFAWWPTVAVLAVAVTTDLMWRRIPNWLTGPFLVAGFSASAWVHGWRGLGTSAEGMALGLGVYGILFWFGGMGAGDVKLCAALGAWIGPGQLLIATILTALAGGVMALVWAVSSGFSDELLADTGSLILTGIRGTGIGGRWKRTADQGSGAESGPESDRPSAIATERNTAPLRRKMPYAPAIAVGALLSFLAR
jgi:prepilin peptidase CpaA